MIKTTTDELIKMLSRELYDDDDYEIEKARLQGRLDVLEEFIIGTNINIPDYLLDHYEQEIKKIKAVLG